MCNGMEGLSMSKEAPKLGSSFFFDNLTTEVVPHIKERHYGKRIICLGSQAGMVEEVCLENDLGPLISIFDPKSDDIDTLAADHSTSIFLIYEKHAETQRQICSLFFRHIGCNLICNKDREIAESPLFLVTIPKSGTHLLTQIVEELGYKPGNAKTGFMSNMWYPLIDTNTHTTAKRFFVDFVAEAPHGGRLHPFPWSPTLFIYRNPLDILISEANYYPKPGKTLFASYFEGKTKSEIIDDLIDGTVLPPFVERIADFHAWAEFPNVVNVSYEELATEARGGMALSQEKTIWSLILKLNRSCSLAEIITRLNANTEQSATFFEGTMGKFRKELSSKAHARLMSSSKNLLSPFGYFECWDDDYTLFRDDIRTEKRFSSKIASNRQKLLSLGDKSNFRTPVLIDEYRGYNLVAYMNHFVALKQGVSVDFEHLNYSDFEFHDVDLEKLTLRIMLRSGQV